MAIIGKRKSEYFQILHSLYKFKILTLKMLTMNLSSTESIEMALKKDKSTHFRLLFLKKSLMISNRKSFWLIRQLMSRLRFQLRSLMDIKDQFHLKKRKSFILKKFLLQKRV